MQSTPKPPFSNPDVLGDLVRSIVAETIRQLAPHLAGGDELVPLARLAEELGVRVRVLSDEGRRGRLRVEGPRSARVVRRAEVDRWLATSR